MLVISELSWRSIRPMGSRSSSSPRRVERPHSSHFVHPTCALSLTPTSSPSDPYQPDTLNMGGAHNKGMNLTVRSVTRLAWLPSHRGRERTRTRRAPARSAVYARRCAGEKPPAREPDLKVLRYCPTCRRLRASAGLIASSSIVSIATSLGTYMSSASEWCASSGFSLLPSRRTTAFQLVNSDEFGRILSSI